MLDHYVLYRNLTSTFDIFHISGNHDEFGLFSFLSPFHYFLQNTTLDYLNFSVMNVIKQFDNQNFHFIGINPYIYPTGRSPFEFQPRVSSSLLELFNETINDVPIDEPLIVFVTFSNKSI